MCLYFHDLYLFFQTSIFLSTPVSTPVIM
jgi:hypothetical protein